MLNPNDHLIKTSRLVVRLAILINRLFLFAVLLGLLVSFLSPHLFTVLMIQPDLPFRLVGLRWLLVLGLALAAATEVLLRALARIIATAAAGDPFIAGNAQQLQTIGWALLALQLLEVPAAWIARSFPLGSAAPEGSFSPAGWLAVLMVFVLSRVFAAGSRMRDDLEGTV